MAGLSDEVRIGAVRLRNRMVLPPITTKYAALDGTVTEQTLRFYGERSRDVGLVVVEATAVRADGRIVPESLGLWDDMQIEGMARLSDKIRGGGAVPVIQLNHAGARCAPLGGELQGASPSGVAFRADNAPFSMNRAQIDLLVDAFAGAAVRAVSAGFAGVEIHGAHFYLVSQFLSPLTNRRDDEYGGNVRSRAALAVEVLKAVRARVGLRPILLFRLNARENLEGGQTLEETLAVGRLLKENGVDILDVSVVPQVTWVEEDGKRLLSAVSALSKDDPPGANVPLAGRIRKEIGVPVIAVGKLGEGRAAEDAVADGGVDMVAIGRQMIADPDAAGKILDGKGDEIIRCKQCMTCFASLPKPTPLTCAVNPKMGK